MPTPQASALMSTNEIKSVLPASLASLTAVPRAFSTRLCTLPRHTWADSLIVRPVYRHHQPVKSGGLTLLRHLSTATMEAAASVAGLLSLSGQILGGLFKLGQHIQDVRELGDRTETVGKETELLVKTVTELESILQRLEGGIAKHPNMTPGVSVLQHQLEQCQNDLKPWIEAHLQATEPRKKRQKVANALLGSSIRAIQKLESKLASHRAQIGLGVGALNT